jgi:hypothetical protein
VKRAEVAGERAGAAICADERVERDLADAQVPAPEWLQSPLDLVELEQGVAAAGPQSLHLEVKRTTGVRVRTRSGVPAPSSSTRPLALRTIHGRPRSAAPTPTGGAGPGTRAECAADGPAQPGGPNASSCQQTLADLENTTDRDSYGALPSGSALRRTPPKALSSADEEVPVEFAHFAAIACVLAGSS